MKSEIILKSWSIFICLEKDINMNKNVLKVEENLYLDFNGLAGVLSNELRLSEFEDSFSLQVILASWTMVSFPQDEA